MDIQNHIFKEEFVKHLRSSQLTISPVKEGNDFVVSNEASSKSLLVRTVCPTLDMKDLMHLMEPAPFYNAQVIVYYRFMIDDPVYTPDLFIFCYENSVLKRNDFLIFRTHELLSRLLKIGLKPSRSGYYKLLVWIFRGDFVFVANNISGESEWYLLGGLGRPGNGRENTMASDTERDLSRFLNRWGGFR